MAVVSYPCSGSDTVGNNVAGLLASLELLSADGSKPFHNSQPCVRAAIRPTNKVLTLCGNPVVVKALRAKPQGPGPQLHHPRSWPSQPTPHISTHTLGA